MTPIYFNAEAVGILAYPVRPQEIDSLQSFVAAKIRSLFDSCPDPSGDWPVREFISGRRRYVCRVFPLEAFSPAPTLGASVAVCLERIEPRGFDSSRTAAQFNLTHREQQAVELLVRGLTNKEIAARMQISPNTVKAFLRFIMTKVGVATRCSLVAQLLTDTFQ